MLVAPARRNKLMTVLRSVAITWGAFPVRTWERSSSKVTSRTPCSRFSGAPVALDPRGEGGRWRGVMVGGGDQVDDLDALVPTPGHGAPDLRDLRGAGEVDPGRGGGDLDGAGDGPAVPGGGHPVARDVLQGRSLRVWCRPGWFFLTVNR
jgi:hypothetical protein